MARASARHDTGVGPFFSGEDLCARSKPEANMPRNDPRRNKNEVIPSDSGRDISQDKQNNRISDPDLPPGMAGIDKETYLRLRSEYIWRLRGWEPGKPFALGTRGRSLQQMKDQ